MSAPSVIVFDVNETLSDMSPLAARFVEVGAPQWLSQVWFASVLRDGFALAAAGSSARFADLGAELLRSLLPEDGLTMDVDAAVQHVLAGFTSLALHPDVAPGVQALHEAGLRLTTLSNGAATVAETLLDNAGLRDLFEQLLSVEDAGIWKPAAGAYAYAARRCEVPAEELMLVAVHPWDVDGAARAGLRTAYVNRTGAAYPSWATPPTHTVSSLVELAERLGG
jgi:2-haloacid dehalogenase